MLSPRVCAGQNNLQRLMDGDGDAGGGNARGGRGRGQQQSRGSRGAAGSGGAAAGRGGKGRGQGQGLKDEGPEAKKARKEMDNKIKDAKVVLAKFQAANNTASMLLGKITSDPTWSWAEGDELLGKLKDAKDELEKDIPGVYLELATSEAIRCHVARAPLWPWPNISTFKTQLRG
jgi:hypothetical protein